MARPSRARRLLSSLRWQGFSFQLFVFIVLPLAVLLIAISFGSLALHGQAMRLLVGERDQRAAQAAVAAISEQLSHRAAAIRGLALHAESAHVTSTRYDEFIAGYDFLLPDFDGGLLLTTPDGTFLASPDTPDLWQARPVAELLQQTSGQVRRRSHPPSSILWLASRRYW